MVRKRGRGAQSFLLGSVVGASAVAAAVRRRARRHRSRETPVGLAAFESAPCYRELLEEERRTADRLGRTEPNP